MLVFAKKKLVFLAMPKTGTTSLEAALAPKAEVIFRSPPNLKHTTAHRFHRYLKPYFKKCGMENLRVVTVVRHPVSWLGSWYKYRRRDAKRGAANSTENVTFNEFVQGYCADKQPVWAHVGIPSDFVRKGNGDFGVDNLFQYEQMDHLIQFFEDQLGNPITLERRNVSPVQSLALDPTIEAQLERKFPQMFEDWEAARL